MTDRAGVVAVSVVELERVETIDGGDTVVLRLRMACGQDVALMVPRRVAFDIGRRLGNLERCPAPAGRGGP